MMPVLVSTRIHVFAGQALIVHISGETACAVAALLDLAAVGIEDAVTKIGVGLCSGFRPAAPGRSRRRSGGRPVCGCGGVPARTSA